MALRIKIKVEVGAKLVETRALVNTGFETDEPQLLVPNRFLSINEINLDLREAGRPVEYGTAGGPISMYVLQDACSISVIEPDRTKGLVKADLVVSPVEREVIISDTLADSLEIVILSPGRGCWKFVDDPPEKTRTSYAPQIW